mgnify:CR=1 FL=1
MIIESMCLAIAVYFESANEPEYDAGLAVAEVILNRVESSKFPGTICAVVKQDKGPKPHDCQFSFYCDGKAQQQQQQAALEQQAKEALDGKTLGHNALFYHANYTEPYWSSKLDFVGKVGKHLFYK